MSDTNRTARTDDAALIERWRAIHAAPIPGWDVAGVGVRIDGPDWSYESIVRERLAAHRPASVLDMGTGGGEVLGRLADVLPADTVATEGWPPNVPVAERALQPLGVDVVRYDATADEHMPFPTERFDLAIARHEAYDPAEIARVLAPAGRFVTQQVDGRSCDGFDRLFGAAADLGDVNLAGFSRRLVDVGFEIERAEESTGTETHPTVDSLVGFLSMAPWSAPGFDVDIHADVLLRLHHDGTPIVIDRWWFLIVATTPSRGRGPIPAR